MTFGAQEETVRFLMAQGEDARTIVTHISIVVLTKERVYKLKRDVVFPYLDFHTPQIRSAMCEREYALNRRTAPQLYLAVRRITRGGDGALCFDGDGALIDAVVEMRRFEEENLLDNLAVASRLSAPLVERLAARIAQFHDGAEVIEGRGGALVMASLLDLGDASSLAKSPVVSAQERRALADELRAVAQTHGALLDRRRDAGKVRRCHGDLTLRNICLVDGEPTPFDCIEFSDDLATIDVLYDLAFLLMDLRRRGLDALAAFALNRYLDNCDEVEGLPLLPFFMALRAAIRADVAAARALDADADHAALNEETRDYFDLSRALLRPATPRIVAIGGLSGSGKSSVAAALAPLVGAAPGARTLNSDRLRKKLFGVAPTSPLPQEAYTAAVSARVYEAMQNEASRVASFGWCVIVDAVYARESERDALEEAAKRVGVPFAGFWLEADGPLRVSRVGARQGDVSDATQEIAARQRNYDLGEMRWTRVDATHEVGVIAQEIAARQPSLQPSPALQEKE
ncbi:aminoglycoside phosphotransferase [Methylosinus sp. R-45379]|uniref:bifunctional aminoglycoside phosphotransferase/ATP-binding protein n=1 Tax=unclassified Methylosinus TaxID=2624500 RepID=UPI000465BFB5|nr:MULTISPECIES: AAA family ATPase [unclassified Methylosinus]OAI25243.1 aminoglycoside phosphotransferase [Methylosinus sp. R-45379]